MTKRFTRKEYAIYEKGNPICMTLRDVDKRLNELWEENEQLGLEVNETNYEYNMLILKYQKLERENKELKDKWFEAEKTLIIETADISDYAFNGVEKDIEELRKEVYGDDV